MREKKTLDCVLRALLNVYFQKNKLWIFIGLGLVFNLFRARYLLTNMFLVQIFSPTFFVYFFLFLFVTVSLLSIFYLLHFLSSFFPFLSLCTHTHTHLMLSNTLSVMHWCPLKINWETAFGFFVHSLGTSLYFHLTKSSSKTLPGQLNLREKLWVREWEREGGS